MIFTSRTTRFVRSVFFAVVSPIFAVAACSSGAGQGLPPGGDPANPTPNNPAPKLEAVRGLEIAEVAIFQGVKVTLAKDGAPVTAVAPVIANREGLVRVYVKPLEGYAPREVTGELTVSTGSIFSKVFRDTKTISGASTELAQTSTFNFEVPADAITPETRFSVALSTTADQTIELPSSGAKYPANNLQSMNAKPSSVLKVTLLPVRYSYGGSQRSPDVSSARLTQYKNRLMVLYPVTDVELTIGDEFPWAQQVGANGSGWSALLQAIMDKRQEDRPPSNVYYFGLFVTAGSFNQYCPGGCVTGLSLLADNPSQPYLRASIGVGYPGEDSTWTMAHEIGHAHGRNHAPCEADDVDADFPYSDGGIGVLGYDIVNKTFKEPSRYSGMMGYCDPTWVSDYTFGALFQRVRTVSGTADFAFSNSSPTRYRFVEIDNEGRAKLGSSITLRRRPDQAPKSFEYRRPDGSKATANAQFHPYSHLPGGLAIVPEDHPIVQELVTP